MKFNDKAGHLMKLVIETETRTRALQSNRAR